MEDKFLFRMLSLTQKLSKEGSIYIRTSESYAPLSLFVNCSDIFMHASSDSEKITESNIDILEQSIKDANEINSPYADILFVTRCRNRMPVTWFLKKLNDDELYLFKASVLFS